MVTAGRSSKSNPNEWEPQRESSAVAARSWQSKHTFVPGIQICMGSVSGFRIGLRNCGFFRTKKPPGGNPTA